GILAQCALREVHDEELAVVHHGAEVEAVLPLADDVPDDRRQEELAGLVLKRRDYLLAGAGGVGRILVPPELERARIPKLREDARAEVVVHEKPVQVEERGAWGFEESEDRVLHEVLRARPPELGPEAFEDRHEPGGDEVVL